MSAPQPPTLREIAKLWLRLGLLSFGGPAAQIALMHQEVVERRRWVSESRFLHALNFCMLLPGPEATQLAAYLGWLMRGVTGGLLAGLLFILPGAMVMLGLAFLYARFGTVSWIAALFFGLKCAVLVLVFAALLSLGRRTLQGPVSWLTALGAFVALTLFAVPFPLVVAAAFLFGLLWPAAFLPRSTTATDAAASAMTAARHLLAEQKHIRQRESAARRAGAMILLLWLCSVTLTVIFLPRWGDIAWFCAKMALVTFGGAYAVLAYVAQEAVERYRWLSATEMLAGLGLAETTPGPLILVVEFVGFLAGFRDGGAGFGVIGGLLTLWVIFAPSFAWIFLGAPLVERLHELERLRSALAAVTVAVVGVVASLALWFALRLLFAEQERWQLGLISLDLPLVVSLRAAALILVGLSGVLFFGLRLGFVRTVAIAAGAGLPLAFWQEGE